MKKMNDIRWSSLLLGGRASEAVGRGFRSSLPRSGLPSLSLVAAFSLLLSCNQDETAFGPQDATAFESSITGQVTDRSGRPLSGALVTVLPSGATTVSGSEGRFTLSGLQSGEHRIAVAKDDYRDTTWATATRLGLTTTRDVGAMAMRFRYATVKGIVVDSTGTAVAPERNVAIAVEDQTATAQMVSEGKFTLARVEPGRVRLFTAIQGVGYGTLDTLLDADSTLQGVKIRIDRRGGTVVGQIVDAGNVGVSGALVSAVGGALKTITASDGSFRITEVPGEGKVVLEVVKGDVSTVVSGVRVAEGSKTDLSKITVGSLASTGDVLIRPGVAMALSTDSVAILVADTVSRDETFRVLRYVWKAEGDATWDTTATNVWVVDLWKHAWIEGAHKVQVKALALSSSNSYRESETGTITVNLLPSPDWIGPAIARRSPVSRDTSVLWKDADYTFAWRVTDDRELDSVWLDGSPLEVGDSGKCSRTLALAEGRHEYMLKARDKAGNVAWDTVVVTRMERDSIGPVVESRSPAQSDTSLAETDTSATVTWFLKDASGFASIDVGGVPVTDSAGWVVRRVRLPAGDTLVRLRMVDRSGNESFDSVRLRRYLPPVMTLVNPTHDMVYPYGTKSVYVFYQILDTSLIEKAWVNDYPVMQLVPGESMVPVNIPDTGMTLRLRILRRSGIVTVDSLHLGVMPRPDPSLAMLSVSGDSIGLVPDVYVYRDTVYDSAVTVKAVAKDSAALVFIENIPVNSYTFTMMPGELRTIHVSVKAGGDTLGYGVEILYRDTTFGIPWNSAVSTYGVLQDVRDGQTYRTVTIDGREWMAENLNFKGDGRDSGWAYDGMSDNAAKYGRLYGWSSFMALPDSCDTVSCQEQVTQQWKGICPDGWHVPDMMEWDGFMMDSTAGSKLMSTRGWLDSENGTDAYGFRALPAGAFNTDGFNGIGTAARWWANSDIDMAYAFYRELHSGSVGIYGGTERKSGGLSVRCIRNY